MSDENFAAEPLPGKTPRPDEGIASQPILGEAPQIVESWFLRVGDKTIGPFMAAELEANAAAGTLGPDDLVRDRDGPWTPARHIPFLASLLQPGPGSARNFSGDRPAGPAGIGGWLILPASGLILGPIMNAVAISQDVSLLGQADVVNRPDWRLVLVAEIVLDLAFLAFLLYAAVVFFQRKRSAPPLMIALYLSGVAVMGIDSAMLVSVLDLRPEFGAVARPVLTACIWVPYFLVSRRVKATFIY
jgi:hypothetical protein